MRIRPTWRGLWYLPRPGEGRLLRWRWLVLPLGTGVVLAVALALAQCRESRAFFQVLLAGGRVPGLAWRMYVQRQESALATLISRSPSPGAARVPEVHLSLSTNALDEMVQASMKRSTGEEMQVGGERSYHPAVLELGGGNQVFCQASLRGSSDWHRTRTKPSFRVRLPRQSIRDGRRYVELQRPEDVLAVKNWLPEELGRQGGMLTGLSRHVRLLLNGRYLGIYLDTCRPDDLLAIRQGRLPGVFFKGDAIGARDSLWDRATLWRAFGEVTPEDWDLLEELMELARDPVGSPQQLERLDRVLDLEQYARWCALAVLTGSSHVDDRHNHLYYLSSYRGKLEPVVWDFNGYGILLPSQAQVNLVLNRLQFLTYHDPRFLFRRDQLLHEWNEGLASPAAVRRQVDEVLDRILPDLQADPGLGELSSLVSRSQAWPGAPRDVVGYLFFCSHAPSELENFRRRLFGWVAQRHDLIERYLSEAHVNLRDAPGGCVATVFGRVAVEVHARKGEVRDGWGRASSRLLLYPGLARTLRVETDLDTPIQYADPAPLEYPLKTSAAELEFRNAVTGRPLEPEALPADLPRPFSVHPWFMPAPSHEDVLLGPGRVELRQDLRLGPGQRLGIRPGTTILLAAGVGIYSRGTVWAEGTAARPIRLEPLEAGPWGGLGLAGGATGGTRLAHVSVRGGSLGRLDGIRFKGMVSVYDCPDLVLTDCEFGENSLSDDAVNLGDSRVRVQDCRFARAASDGLDCDQVTGSVVGCRFEDSGNDGLDLSQSRLEVSDCSFAGNQDKGISVGEGTRVVVRDCRFERCHIGIQSKDGSRAEAVDCSFVDNGVGVDAYRKKWLFGVGGTVVLRHCRIVGSEPALRLDSLSRLVLDRTEAALPAENRAGVYRLR